MNSIEKINDVLSLEYKGENADLGRMNSYQVAESIVAFSDYLTIIAKNIYGEKIELKTEIQGIRGESFDIDFYLAIGSFAVQTASFFSSPIGFNEYFEFIKDTIKIWLHLKGEPPKEIVTRNDHNVTIENRDGQVININKNVINIIADSKAGKAVEQFISKPLESGIAELSIKSPKLKDETIINKNQATYFKQIGIETPLTESEVKMGLQIESPTFKEGNKWRFYDGQNSFFADIQDENFLKKVNLGIERFGKGDTLMVILRIKQSSTLGNLSLERSVVEVLDHQVPPPQAHLTY